MLPKHKKPCKNLTEMIKSKIGYFYLCHQLSEQHKEDFHTITSWFGSSKLYVFAQLVQFVYDLYDLMSMKRCTDSDAFLLSF